LDFDNFNDYLYYSAFMSRRLPEFIDPFHLVERRQVLKGSVSLSKMQRLASLSMDPNGNAELEIHFGRDEAGLPVARGTITTVVRLQCQRCLEPWDFELETEFTLGVVASLSEAGNLPENYEPLIVDEPPMSLAELIEDEILLALPAVAMHSKENCALAQPAAKISDTTARQTSGERKRKPKHKKESGVEGMDSMYNGAPERQAKETDAGRQNPFAVLEQLKGKLAK
jgi:uncharacterized protein